MALEATLVPDEACGAAPINGLLRAARRHGMQAELVDLRNSGDTAGDRNRVAEYLDTVLFRRSLEVSSRGLIRLPDGDVLHANSAVRPVIELTVGFFIEILGQILRRRIDGCERLEIVDHLMIKPVDDMSHDVAQLLEVEQ